MWVPVFTVLFVLAMSLVIVRVATIALMLTGVSRDLARFQALSAFTGCGFSTRESEDIVNNPVRRRIVMQLMLLGNAGIVITIASVLSLLIGNDEDSPSFWLRLLVLAAGTLLLWVAAGSRTVEKAVRQALVWAVARWYRVEVRDYLALLRVARDYTVSEMRVHRGDWLEGRTLAQLQLTREGVLVLGIERRDGEYTGTPHGESKVAAGDSLILYGRQESLLELTTRRAGMVGNLSHVIAVTRQVDVKEQQQEGGADTNA